MIEQIRLASKGEDDEEIETTKVIGNEMFFYGDVSNESILCLLYTSDAADE